MIKFNTEYFGNNCYFYIKDRGDKISLYYNVADTLTESRKSDDKLEFDKKDEKKVKGVVSSALKTKSKVSKKGLDNKLKSIKSKKEIEEFVDEDGTMLTSRIPPINTVLSPRKTMDQTVPMARVANDPVMRGYRVYYGESEEKGDEMINEVDYSEAFGYAETENMDYNNTVKTLAKMGVENPEERAQEFGKLPKQKKHDGKLKQRLSEKDSIEEGKVRFYDNNNRWFSSSSSLGSIKDHKKRFGDDIKFSVDGHDGLFNDYEEFKSYLNKKKNDVSTGFMFSDAENAKNRVLNKRKERIKNDTIEEQQKQQMTKMVEDILTKKSKNDSEVIKNNSISKILLKNIQSIKKIAEKEGISINMLIKSLKSNE